MPTLAEVLAAVTDFISTYVVFIVAGLVIGLAVSALGRLVRAGR